jgi:hypothetical protein
MSGTFTLTATESFTIVHARYMASKVATDLKRFQRFYGSPSDAWIDNYERELAQLLKHDVVEEVVYGFKRNGCWTTASVRYRALPGGNIAADDDPGKIRPGLDVTGAVFTSFLSYNGDWDKLSASEREAIKRSLPFQRSSGSTPTLEAGYWADDLTYAAGGRGLGRSTVKR